MSNFFKVCVVIPCFNHGEFLSEAIESVALARRRDLEIVIVDDGSTDENTRQKTEGLAAQGFHVIRQANGGLASARNAGIATTSAEYIFPLDADDRMRTEWLNKGIGILDSHPQVGVVYGDAERFGVRAGRWRAGRFDWRKLIVDNFICASALFRRQVWEDNRGYDGTMPVQGFEDWDFWLGALERGWKFSYVPEVSFDYRQHQHSMLTRARQSYDAVREFVVRKHARLYLESLIAAEAERQSVRSTTRILRGLLTSRIRARLDRLFGRTQ